MYRLAYIQFIHEISGLGTYWSVDKHAKVWTVEEKGSWMILTNTDNGQRRRIPITSVATIHEALATEPETKTKKDKI